MMQGAAAVSRRGALRAVAVRSHAAITSIANLMCDDGAAHLRVRAMQGSRAFSRTTADTPGAAKFDLNPEVRPPALALAPRGAPLAPPSARSHLALLHLCQR